MKELHELPYTWADTFLSNIIQSYCDFLFVNIFRRCVIRKLSTLRVRKVIIIIIIMFRNKPMIDNTVDSPSRYVILILSQVQIQEVAPLIRIWIQTKRYRSGSRLKCTDPEPNPWKLQKKIDPGKLKGSGGSGSAAFASTAESIFPRWLILNMFIFSSRILIGLAVKDSWLRAIQSGQPG